jgi:hypothetical protein
MIRTKSKDLHSSTESKDRLNLMNEATTMVDGKRLTICPILQEPLRHLRLPRLKAIIKVLGVKG